MYYFFIARANFPRGKLYTSRVFFISLVICIKNIPEFFTNDVFTLQQGGKMGGKNVTCFATLLQNEFHWYVSRFATQTCPATNQVAAGCEKLLQNVESSYTFCNKLCTYCAFTGPRQNENVFRVCIA